MHYASDVPMPTQKAANGYKRLVRLGGLYMSSPGHLKFAGVAGHPTHTSKPSKSIKIKFLVLSTSFVSVSARLALERVREQDV